MKYEWYALDKSFERRFKIIMSNILKNIWSFEQLIFYDNNNIYVNNMLLCIVFFYIKPLQKTQNILYNRWNCMKYDWYTYIR